MKTKQGFNTYTSSNFIIAHHKNIVQGQLAIYTTPTPTPAVYSFYLTQSISTFHCHEVRVVFQQAKRSRWRRIRCYITRRWNLWDMFSCIDKDPARSTGFSTAAVIVAASCTLLSAPSLLRRTFSIRHFFIFFDQRSVEFGLLRGAFCHK